MSKRPLWLDWRPASQEETPAKNSGLGSLRAPRVILLLCSVTCITARLHLTSYLCTHRLVQLPELIREVPLWSGQWLAQKPKAGQVINVSGLIYYEWNIYITFPHEAQGPLQKGRGKDFKSWKPGITRTEPSFLDAMSPLHTPSQPLPALVAVQGLYNIKPANTLTLRGTAFESPIPNWKAVDNWWLLWKGKPVVFFKGCGFWQAHHSSENGPISRIRATIVLNRLLKKIK